MTEIVRMLLEAELTKLFELQRKIVVDLEHYQEKLSGAQQRLADVQMRIEGIKEDLDG